MESSVACRCRIHLKRVGKSRSDQWFTPNHWSCQINQWLFAQQLGILIELGNREIRCGMAGEIWSDPILIADNKIAFGARDSRLHVMTTDATPRKNGDVGKYETQKLPRPKRSPSPLLLYPLISQMSMSINEYTGNDSRTERRQTVLHWISR